MTSRTNTLRLAAVATSALTFLIISGCSATTAPAGGGTTDNKVIGVSVADQKSLFYVAAVEGMKQAAEAAAAGVKLANDPKIRVVAVDQKPECGNGQLATYIATDGVKAADKLFTWLFDKIGGSGDIAILQGPLGATAELQRSQSWHDALKKYPNIEVVGKESAGSDETKTFNASQNILTGKGSTVPKLQYQDTVLVTKENVADDNAAKFYGSNFK